MVGHACKTKLMVTNQIGVNLKKALDDRGHSQVWLADQLDVTPNAVSKWVRLGTISRENAIRVSKLLDMPLNQLLIGEGADENGLSPNELRLVTMYRAVIESVRRDVWRQLEQAYDVAVQYERKYLATPKSSNAIKATVRESRERFGVKKARPQRKAK